MAKISIGAYRKIFVGVIVAVIAVLLIALAADYLIRKKLDISINSIPEGASVEFDGKTYKTPINLKEIKEGSYTLVFSREGYIERKEKIQVSESNRSFLFRLYTQETAPSVLSSDLSESAQVSGSEFEKLSKFLPFKNIKFKVEKQIVGGRPSIAITLYAILNRPSQFKEYKKDLNQFGKEALDWIRTKGVDPDKLNIIWNPENPFK